MKKKRITPVQWTLLGLSIIAVLVLAAVLFRGDGGEKVKSAVGAPPREGQPEPAPEREAKTVRLFFPAESDNLLHSEPREIFAGSTVEEAEQAVRELIRGSDKGYISPLPPETKLRQLFVTKEGVAYVDFSREVMDKHPSGSSAELATVYAVVNTLTFNFKPIKKVFILVEGGERETLGGHINLGQPFLPLYSLNAR
jgi:spore germination protein GerM